MDNKPSDYAIAKAFWEINHKDGWDSSPNALSLKCAVIERAKEIDVTEQPHGASAGSDVEPERIESLLWYLRDAANSICGQTGASTHQDKLLELYDIVKPMFPNQNQAGGA